MAKKQLVSNGAVINTIIIDEDCIAITQAEADAMDVEWFRAWGFYILPDGCELRDVPQPEQAEETETPE